MKKSKITKILCIALVVFMLATAFSNVLCANNTGDLLDPDTMKGSPTNTSNKAGSLMNQILGIVQVVAMGVAVIMLVVLAIKYVSAAPGEKADIKKSMIIYVVGAILLFGATGILQIIKTLAQGDAEL